MKQKTIITFTYFQNCMKRLLFLLIVLPLLVFSQEKKDTKWFKGMYIQWGYNTEWYTKSTIHFKMSNGNNFELHDAIAHDQPDMSAIKTAPTEVSIPQYNYRIGFYLNRSHTRAFEINFDHAKYVVTDGQMVHVTGTIDGKPVDGDSVMDGNRFLHFEHTDGANWLHFNYVQQHELLPVKSRSRTLISYVWKAGAGINIPRTDFTWRGDELNNAFHIAGYNISAEGGLRVFPFKRFFIEGTAKTGFVQYLNALADTKYTSGNRASHHFVYFELIATLGYEINF